MERRYDEIYEIFYRNPYKSGYIRKNDIYQGVLKEYSAIFSKRLLDYLLEKMPHGEFRACSLFYDLIRANGKDVPLEVIIIHGYPYINTEDTFLREFSSFRTEQKLQDRHNYEVDALFRFARISNSE